MTVIDGDTMCKTIDCVLERTLLKILSATSCESTLLIEHDHLSYLKTLVIHGFPLPCKSSEITTRFNDGPTSLS